MTRTVNAFILLVLVLTVLVVSPASAQTRNFRNYSVENGLPFVNVAAIYQDNNGYLWLGGYGGLSRFNGKEFVNYSPKNGLANNSVTSIAQDPSGALWIGTQNGVSRLTGDVFRTYRETEGLANNSVNCVAVDNNGFVWFGTRDGLSRFDGKTFTTFTTKEGLAGNSVLCIYEDNQGNSWFGTTQGVSCLQGGKFVNYTAKDGICDTLVKDISEDKQGNIWFATPNGACVLDPHTNKFTAYNTSNGLPDNDVRKLVRSRKGDLWLGTSKGLVKFNGRELQHYPLTRDLNSNLVFSLFEDFEGNLWIGTYSGLFRYRSDDFIHFDQKDGLANSFIYQIFRDQKGILWVCTGGGGVNLYDGKGFTSLTTKDGLTDNSVTAALQDPDGTVWLATNSGLSRYSNGRFTNYSKADGLLNNYNTCLLRDKNGNLWIGGRGGVTRYDGTKFDKFPLAVGEHNYDISTMLQDRKGNIWFGAYQGGLYKYDGKTFSEYSKKLGIKSTAYMAMLEDKQGGLYIGTFDGVFFYNGHDVIQFSEKDGLSSDLVYTMVFDNNENTLWVGTNQGLNKINLLEFMKTGRKMIEHYGKEEGFSGVESNTNGAYKDVDGTIWFGTVNGLIHYNPMDYEPNLLPPKINITGFKLFYKDTMLAENIRLPFDQNNISIGFIGICLTNPSKVKYKYMLDGFDRKWSPETQNTFATYSNLPPGKYTFKVKSCNNEGIWTETVAAFPFTIKAPYWKTWWFWSITSGLMLVLIYLSFRYRIQQIRHRERFMLNQKVQMATNELKALRAQMNPHFVFNSLNSIQNFIMNSEGEAAARYLSKFAKLMRTILNNSERATVTIREEMDALRLYLELEVLRFENKFDYSIEIDPEVDQDFFEIPTMLIQPYVENAILHGLMPKQSKGHLLIRIDMDKTHIICSVIDNGIGRKRSMKMKENSKKDHVSMGMRITRDRLAVLNNIHNSNLSVNITDLETEDQQPQGTKIEIFIPIV